MKLSIVIPAYNEEAYIGECLRSIEKYKNGNILEVIVVENACTDQTRAVVSKFPFATLVSEPRKGVNYARQKGLLAARGELVGFLDADCALTPDWLSIAFQVFEKNADVVGLSGPAIIEGMGSFYKLLVKIYFNFILIPFAILTGTVVLLGNFIVRKNAIMEIGGFDQNIAFYGDDTNLARRLAKVGMLMFRRDFLIYTSPRRLKKQGTIKTGLIYIINHLSEKFLHRPATKNYLDIR